MMEKYYLFIFLAFISDILGTISGFGSSILFVPIALLFFDFKTVLGIPAVFFVIIGALFTSYLPTESLEFMMNIALVLLSIFLKIKFNSQLKQ